jgi:anti-sigma factor RsiW
MSPLNHDEVQEMLPAAALEILDAAELEQVTAHAGTCAECAGLLREYREVATSLSLAVPGQPLDPGRSAATRARLLARLGASRRPSSRAHRFGADRWSGWLVAAGLAGVLLIHHGIHRPLGNGWIAAGVLLLLLLVVIVYARVQRRRAGELQDRLADLERQQTKKPSG